APRPSGWGPCPPVPSDASRRSRLTRPSCRGVSCCLPSLSSVRGLEGPAGTVRSVIDADAGSRQRVTEGVGTGPVLLRAGRLPRRQLGGDQGVQGLVLAAGSRGVAGPLGRQGVQAEHVEHAAQRPQGSGELLGPRVPGG